MGVCVEDECRVGCVCVEDECRVGCVCVWRMSAGWDVCVCGG